MLSNSQGISRNLGQTFLSLMTIESLTSTYSPREVSSDARLPSHLAQSAPRWIQATGKPCREVLHQRIITFPCWRFYKHKMLNDLSWKQVCLHPGVGVLGRCRSDEVPAVKCSDVPDIDDCFVDGHHVRDFLHWVRLWITLYDVLIEGWFQSILVED